MSIATRAIRNSGHMQGMRRVQKEAFYAINSVKAAFLMAFVLFAAINAFGGNFEYEADGKLEGQQYLAVGKSEAISPVFFQAYVRDCQWLIKVTRSRSGTPGRVWEISSDGVNMYNFGADLGTAQGRDSWGGAVARDGVPFFGPIPTIPVIWLALADSCFLDRKYNYMAPPYSADVLRTPLPVHVIRRAKAPHLPERITFMDDGYNRKDGTPIKRRPPYDKGFTNAVFSVSSFTNLGQVELPLQFTLQVFRPADPPGLNMKLELDSVYRGHISNVSRFCSLKDFVPKIQGTGGGFISDTRFAIANARVPMPFYYRASNWLSEEEVRQLPKFAHYMKSQKALSNFVPVLAMKGAANHRASPLIRSLIICTILIAALVPALFFWKRKLKE